MIHETAGWLAVSSMIWITMYMIESTLFPYNICGSEAKDMFVLFMGPRPEICSPCLNARGHIHVGLDEYYMISTMHAFILVQVQEIPISRKHLILALLIIHGDWLTSNRWHWPLHAYVITIIWYVMRMIQGQGDMAHLSYGYAMMSGKLCLLCI